MKHDTQARRRRRRRESLSILTALCAAGSVGAQEAETPAVEAATDAAASLPPEVVQAAEPTPKPAPRPVPRPAPKPAPVAPAPEPAIVAPEPVLEVEPTYMVDTLSSPKFTQPLLDTPKTVQVISEKLMQDQGATTLRDALRNVSGVAIQAGEGGAAPGDSMTIRGFGSRNDLFIDGIRDFGAYSRDPFNLEQVEVVKGPGSAMTGRGSTGGSINLVSKSAKLNDFLHTEASVGSDNLLRGTLDYNTRLPIEGAAFRINVMGHENDTPGRDFVKNERWGVAGSLAFGLGETKQSASGKSTFDKNGFPGSDAISNASDNRLYVDFFHFSEKNTPDLGIPWVPNTVTDPTLFPYIDRMPPVPYSNYYGNLLRDVEETETSAVTLRFEHDFNDSFTLREQIRYGETMRYSIMSAPRIAATNPATVNQTPKLRDDTNTMVTSQTDLLFDFDTGDLHHKGVLGFEYTEETFHREPFTVLNTIAVDLYRPGSAGALSPLIPGTPVGPTGAINHTKSTTVATYLFDTVSITDWLDLSGGVRFDRYDTDYWAVNPAGVQTRLGRTDDVFSGQAAVIVKPVENASVYFGWGTSFNPSGESLSLSDAATATNSFNVGPEISESFELGTKWNVLENRLALSAALFETTKTNARTFDPTDPTAFTVLDGEQRVRGVEFGVAGAVTDWWDLYASYTHLDSEITKSLDPTLLGNELASTPQNTFTLWTQFDLPGGFFVGGGPSFVDSRYSSDANTRLAPSYTLWDAVVGYEVNENITLRVNFYNLGDEEYIDRVGGAGGQFIPGAGRSVMFSVSGKF